MTDYTTVEACPNCDEAGRHRRRVKADPEERYRCRDCGHTFAEPTIRGRKPNVGGLSKYGKALIDADPSEVGT